MFYMRGFQDPEEIYTIFNYMVKDLVEECELSASRNKAKVAYKHTVESLGTFTSVKIIKKTENRIEDRIIDLSEKDMSVPGYSEEQRKAYRNLNVINLDENRHRITPEFVRSLREAGVPADQHPGGGISLHIRLTPPEKKPCDEVIKNHIGKINPDAIRDAKTQEELFDALDLPNKILMDMNGLFARHAVLDTNGKGAEVGKNIYKWMDMGFLWEEELSDAVERYLEDIPEPDEKKVSAFVKTLETTSSGFLKTYKVTCPPEVRLPFIEAVSDALKPFRLKGEAQKHGMIGTYFNDEGVIGGIELQASPDAARHLATVFPQKVLDSEGNKVGPVKQIAFKPEDRAKVPATIPATPLLTRDL